MTDMNTKPGFQPAPKVAPTHVQAQNPEVDFLNEPPLDFSLSEPREKMKNALAAAKEKFTSYAPIVINNKTHHTDEKIEVQDPANNAVIGHSASAGADETELAIQAARAAYPAWRETAPQERIELLRRIADAFRKQRYELTALMVYEGGKPWREADGDVCEAIDFLMYYAQSMEALAEPTRLQRHVLGEDNSFSYDSLGVIGVIGPWNFPLAIPTGMMSAAIVTGNTVVWKPAEQTPLIVHRAMEIMIDCGLPEGVVNYLPGRGEVAGQYLVESLDVDMIVFTGSREVGCHIIRESATMKPGQRFVKRVVTEMGGKNAIIIDSSADLDHAIPDVVYSAFGFAGQKCSACSRLIVCEDVYEPFMQRLAEAVSSLKVLPPENPGCEVGPVTDEDARDKIMDYIAYGKANDELIAERPLGGLEGTGCFVPPTVFAVNDHHAKLAQEEIFGPVVAVIKACNFEHALEIINDTDYGLTGGIMSRTPSHMKIAAQAVRVGNFYINRPVTGSIVGRQPFGGFKMSGIGTKAGGPNYLHQFMHERTISENLTRQGSAPLDM